MIDFAKKVKELGGTAYLVGGYVRDTFLYRDSKDKDFVITGLTQEAFLSAFPMAEKVGKSFPVFLLKIGNGMCEVAFARTEVKTGKGYIGFTVFTSPDVSIENDLSRRDTTMNSIAVDILTGIVFDPFNGRADIANRIIRATSDHFTDDPIRALRAARQAAQFGFEIAETTYQYMTNCKEELAMEPGERFVDELKKALECKKPSIFFRCLQKAGLLEVAYPHIYALIGQTQPEEHHPEGDSFEHSMLVLDEVSKLTNRVEVRFAALVHDIGKGMTPKSELPRHFGHDVTGLSVLKHFNLCMRLPTLWIQCGNFAIKYHMRAMSSLRPGKIVQLLNSLSNHQIRLDGFSAILLVDSGSLPWYIKNFNEIISPIKAVSGHNAPSHLKGKEIGEWIFQKQIQVLKSIEIKYKELSL